MPSSHVHIIKTYVMFICLCEVHWGEGTPHASTPAATASARASANETPPHSPPPQIKVDMTFQASNQGSIRNFRHKTIASNFNKRNRHSMTIYWHWLSCHNCLLSRQNYLLSPHNCLLPSCKSTARLIISQARLRASQAEVVQSATVEQNRYIEDSQHQNLVLLHIRQSAPEFGPHIRQSEPEYGPQLGTRQSEPESVHIRQLEPESEPLGWGHLRAAAWRALLQTDNAHLLMFTFTPWQFTITPELFSINP